MKGGEEEPRASIRRERLAKEIGLREMAKKIGVSPTILRRWSVTSFHHRQRTRSERSPGSSDRMQTSCWRWWGRVASDLKDIIRERPKEMAGFSAGGEGVDGP